jgi:anthranilate synthase component 1
MIPLQFPSFREASRLAKKGNLVPLLAALPADLETPVSVFMKLKTRNRPAFLLESVEGGLQSARYSFIGSDPFAVFSGSGEKYVLQHRSGRKSLEGDPYDLVRGIHDSLHPVPVPGLPRFAGGAVGVFGYDVAQRRENIPHALQVDKNLPEVWLGWYDTVFAFDHVKHQLLVVAHWNTRERGRQGYEAALERAAAQVQKLARQVPSAHPAKSGSARSNFAAGGYGKAVSRAKQYIAAGDIFQVVLSQRFSAAYAGDPFEVYRRLRRINPSPYLYYLNAGDFQVAGSSPETLVRVEGRTLTVCPIAGTRPRGTDRADDTRLEEELLADPKERAEHLMLVDLARNDAGRVCVTGSLRLPDFYTVEKYSHVMHIVSRVEGDLKPRCDALDALAACFPAGTVSGAPKVRAMQIIAELEPDGRGLYAGAAGYLDYFGNLDTCIAIRTLVFANGRVHAQAGAGVVADSEPAREEQETRNKARALLEALPGG